MIKLLEYEYDELIDDIYNNNCTTFYGKSLSYAVIATRNYVLKMYFLNLIIMTLPNKYKLIKCLF